MEEFFTKVSLGNTHTHTFHSATHDVILASSAQVGQVRILLDKLSRHVEETQKRQVLLLSSPSQDARESRTSGKTWSRPGPGRATSQLALALVSFSSTM